MAVKPIYKPARVLAPLQVCLGQAGTPLGRLVFVKDGQRQFSQFAYGEEWLASPLFFDVSPDLSRHAGYQVQKPRAKHDSGFFLALADTEPEHGGAASSPVRMPRPGHKMRQ
jgi:serine/threonine-protein kinase HipA